MTRGAELAVLPGGGDLPQHVFVKVALGVAIFHRHLSHEIDHLGQQCGRGDGEARILHVPCVGRLVPAQRAQERKHMIGHHREHLGGSKVLEARPTVVRVSATPLVFTLGKDLTLDGLTQTARLVFRQGL